MASAVRTEGLAKLYRIGGRQSYGRLTESIAHAVRTPLRRRRDSDGDGDGADTIWALRDVSVEVDEGEVVGIIGRNGAGKTTLLKILSRITAPTAGTAEIHGRVGSLLEVGTGFHPELSGRDNIFLNGAILGMRRAEIARKFDQIVEFAEVSRFLDTPVKRYSSGMYVRLAFAVAAHLEPEILIVDEVLAVGDMAFQRKCLGKMGEVARDGRTVLFVSHNMAAVEALCTRGILIEGGTVTFTGTQSDAIGRYIEGLPTNSIPLDARRDRTGTGALRVTGIDFRDPAGNVLPAVAAGQDIDVVLRYEAQPGFAKQSVVASIAVKNQFDVPVFLHHNRLTGEEFGTLPQRGSFVLRIPRLPLPPSIYRLTYSILADNEYLDSIADAAELTVAAGDFFGTGEMPPSSHGLVIIDGRWHVEAETP
jgi:lipopolysaccharide transport system ATP-binding protein